MRVIAGDVGGTKVLLHQADEKGTVLAEERFDSAKYATFDMAKAGPFPPPENAGSIVAGYHESLAELRAYLVTLDDAALKEPFTLMRGGETLMTVPKVAIVRNILMNHTYHHRGQLSVYLRLLDVPVPPIYGPTADERA